MTEAAPKCPICLVNDRDWDSEPPGPGSYFSHCTRCSLMSGYRDHSHTYRYSATVVQANNLDPNHSWRTAQVMRPLWEDGRHVGYRCDGRSGEHACNYVERFTGTDLEPCAIHRDLVKGACRNHQEHRQERGEVDERGHITDFGRREERRRQDAANRP